VLPTGGSGVRIGGVSRLAEVGFAVEDALLV